MDDLINRQAAIDVVKGIDSHFVKYIEALPSAQPELSDEEKRLIKQLRSYHNGSYAAVLDKLMPSAEPTKSQYKRLTAQGIMRKKGKWTNENACEFCGFQPWFERDIHTLNFCPNCGADMRESGEE